MPAGLWAAVPWLIALSGYDLAQRRLPNWLTLPGAAAVPLFAAGCGRGMPALAGGVALGAMYLLVHLITPGGLGAGDVKLAVGVGALTGCLGVEVWLLAALAAPLLTALWALAALALRGTRTVPHGPSMCLASALAAACAML